MTVKELKKLLESQPDSLVVVLASDAEGNDFRRLHEIELGRDQTRGALATEGGKAKVALILWPE
jgi:hypothetical protein